MFMCMLCPCMHAVLCTRAPLHIPQGVRERHFSIVPSGVLGNGRRASDYCTKRWGSSFAAICHFAVYCMGALEVI